MQLKTIFLIFILASLYGCATPGMPGYISNSVSGFDHTRSISMEPAWVPNSMIKLGLFWSSKINDNKLILIATIKGAHSIPSKNSLHFNIDGNITSLSSIDTLTDIDTTRGIIHGYTYTPGANWSSKRYLVEKEFINKLVNASHVVVKLDLQKTYAEGVFSSDGPTTARPAFKEFIAKLPTKP